MSNKLKVGDEAHMIGWVGETYGGKYEPEKLCSGRIVQVRLDGKCRIWWDGKDAPDTLWHDPKHINPDRTAARFVFRDALERQIAQAESTVTRLKERLAAYENAT